jgi:hypothetical protein
MAFGFAGLLAGEGVSLDALTNRLTFFNILEGVSLPKLPAMLARLMVVAFYDVAGNTVPIHERIMIRTPEGDVLASSESMLSVGSEVPEARPTSHRSIHAVWGLVFKTEGPYELTLEHRLPEEAEWRRICTRRLQVTVDRSYPFFADRETDRPPEPTER